ncbi:MAG: Iron-sulfur cluster assembly scaffold protein IscU [Candidatus Omnitrophica bacterium]|nr:Iron-sulfur cluster assembly scaffold protein IscU [Candidatus Omnitrophota bacterium]
MSHPESSQPVKLGELYQEVILDHNKKPRNYGPLDGATAEARGHNRLCGDSYHLRLRVQDGVLSGIAFEGQGCAISKASASLMTTAVEGKSVEEVTRLKDAFLDLLLREKPADGSRAAVGRLKLFEGVKQFPVRVKCATLIWRALEEALRGGPSAEVSTESGQGPTPSS